MDSCFSDIHSTSFNHAFARTFFCSRPFSPATAISFNRVVFSSSTTPMNPKTMKSTSSQTNTTVPSYNALSLKAAIFKTFALEVGNELNHGTISPSTRTAFFKIMYKVFLLSSKKNPLNNIIASMFLALPLQSVRQNQMTSLFSLIHPLIRTTFIFYMLFKTPSMLLMNSSNILGSFNNWLPMIRQNILHNPTLPSTLKISNLTCCNHLFIFADFLRSSFIFQTFFAVPSSSQTFSAVPPSSETFFALLST